MAPTTTALVLSIPLALLAACATTRDPDPMENLSQPRSTPAPRPTRSAQATTASGESRPPVVVSGTPIDWDTLWAPLAEHSAGVVIAEIALDTLLEREIARQGLTITSADLEAERTALTRTIAQGVGVPDAQAQQLVAQVTRARALGPARMQALLRRNAMLRALARQNLTLDPAAVTRAYEIEHGRRYVTRLITLPTARQAADLRDTLTLGDPVSLRARFAEAAVSSSTDPSGASGGLLGPISPADTTLPSALRDAVASTSVGTISQVLALRDSFALAMVESVIEPDATPFEQARPRLEAAVRQRQERLQMDVIAREMLAAAQVTVLDRSLDWGWQNTRNP